MKPFCFIFSIYFLALSLMPCSDVHASNAPAIAEFASLAADGHSDCPHEKETDFCSPFCTCNCCSQVIAHSKGFRFTFKAIPLDFKSKIAFHYTFDWQSGHLYAIFRPPIV